MAERYTKIFTLSKQETREELQVPVEISAGALLRDNQKGTVLAQIKYKNISSKSIKSLTVNVSAYDKTGAKITGINDFVYEGVIASPEDFFGDKTPIFMSDNNTNSFSVDVILVNFSDGTSWSKFGQQFANTAKDIGSQAVEVAKDVGAQTVVVAKTGVKISALIVNILFTFCLVLGEISIIQELITTPSAKIGVAAVLLGLATIVSMPGLGKLVFRNNYAKKQRLIKWGIFCGIILIDILIMAFVF